MQHPNGSIRVLSSGPWASLIQVRNCPCQDGERRTAIITGEADTFFSIPAKVRVRGKWVSGYVTNADSLYFPEGYEFRANRFGKNGHLIPEHPYRDAKIMADMAHKTGYAKTPAQKLRYMFPADFF